MTRITGWPQAFLGLTFNWGALVGWTAVTGSLALPPVVLYGAGVLWTLAYDTVYAHQDKADDELVGVKSTARLLGAASKPFVALCHTGAVALIAAAGLLAGPDALFLLPLGAAFLYALWPSAGWRPAEPGTRPLRLTHAQWFGPLSPAAHV